MRKFSVVVLSGTVFVAVCAVLTGCGVDKVDVSATGSFELQGRVHGGQQPVSGATIQLYTVGATGNGSAATPMLTKSVTSDGNGNFNITGDYHCTSTSQQVYVVASGGNPGLAGGTYNNALVMVDAIGPCGNLSSIQFVYVGEITTVAAAWALAQFSTSATDIGSSPTNLVGMENAFLDAQLLANPTNGYPPVLGSNRTVETKKIYALANALAACVNSDGTKGCSALFSAATPSGGTAPADTFRAALNIVRNPGQNVLAVFQAIPSQPPFPVTMTAAPHDWTMSLTTTTGPNPCVPGTNDADYYSLTLGLCRPTAVALDGLGNVWAADYYTGIFGYSPQGVAHNTTVLNSSGSYPEMQGIAVDSNNNLWGTDEENPCCSTGLFGTTVKGGMLGFYGATSGYTLGSPYQGQTIFSDNSLDFPQSIAADSNGDILVGNFPNGTVSVYKNGSLVASGLGYDFTTQVSYAAYIVALTADTSHGVWIANGESTTNVTHLDQYGNLLARPGCVLGTDNSCSLTQTNAATACLQYPNGIALDMQGNVWVSNYFTPTATGTVTELDPSGNVLLCNLTGGGIRYPARLTVDAGNHVWVSNLIGGSISEYAGNGGALAAGTAISPNAPTSGGGSYTGGYGGDAGLLEPFNAAPDASGNLWVSNSANNDIVMFFGLATPTATPAGPVPLAP
jgi:streptogramin lyase